MIEIFSKDAGAEILREDGCKNFSSERLKKHLTPVQKQLHSLYGHIIVAESEIPDKPEYLPEHRPGNYARSLFHSGGTLLIALLVYLLPTAMIVSLLLALIAACGWLIELGRMHSASFNERFFAVMGRLAHPSNP